MSISRLYTFTASTKILSAEVGGELDQLVAEVNKMFKKDSSEDLTGALTIAMSNAALILEGSESSAKYFRIRSDGGIIDFDVDDSGYSTMMYIDKVQDQIVVEAANLNVRTLKCYNFYPRANKTYELGDANTRWLNLYLGDSSDGGIIFDSYFGSGALSGITKRLLPDMGARAWAKLTLGASGAVTVTSGFNVSSSSSWSGSNITIVFHTNFSDTHYVPSAELVGTSNAEQLDRVTTQNVNSVIFRKFDGESNLQSGDTIFFRAFGRDA